MVVRFLVLIALCAVAVDGQQCDTEFEGFIDCLRETFKRSGPPGGDGVKAKIDKCFTDNGCDTPKPPGQDQGPPPGGQDGQAQGPPGSGGEDSNRKCVEAIQTGLKSALTTCVRKTDPSFNPPSKLPPDFDGPMEHGGPGDGPGGPFGRGPPPGGFGLPLQIVQMFCTKAPTGAADKVSKCLATEVQKHGPPSEDELRQEYNKRCGDKQTCSTKLSQPCKDKMEKTFGIICQCQQELKPQAQQIFQQAPACKGLQFPEKMGPFGKDCSKKPEDPCQQGFDAFLKQRQQNGPRPGGRGGQGGQGGQGGPGGH